MFLHLHHQTFILNLSMRKLIVLCLVVLLVACKDKEKDAPVEPDYAPAFVGTYSTTTVDGGTTTVQDWEVTNTDKNVLAINYTKSIKVSVSGTVITDIQIRKIQEAKVTAEDSFTIDEVVDVTRTGGDVLKQKLSGVVAKVTNASGVVQLNVTLKWANTTTSGSGEDYLEFKKK